jgi:hypothetical protein
MPWQEYQEQEEAVRDGKEECRVRCEGSPKSGFCLRLTGYPASQILAGISMATLQDKLVQDNSFVFMDSCISVSRQNFKAVLQGGECCFTHCLHCTVLK